MKERWLNYNYCKQVMRASIWLRFLSMLMSLWNALGCISQQCAGCQAWGHHGNHSNPADNSMLQSCTRVCG